MPRNVEIKAKVKDLLKIINTAKVLCNSEGEILKQVDTFFKVPSGRLKLRNFQDDQESQLVYYNRPDIEGPKISDYSICKVANPDDLLPVLRASLGEIGVVEKVRYLFLYGQTRIHIDKVHLLGDFMELEVVLREEQTLSEGQKIAEDLLNKLGVSSDDLISGAYLDQLLPNN